MRLICTVLGWGRGGVEVRGARSGCKGRKINKQTNGEVEEGVMEVNSKWKSFYLASCEDREQKKWFVVRGSMVRRNLHHKVSHNIENRSGRAEKKRKQSKLNTCPFSWSDDLSLSVEIVCF